MNKWIERIIDGVWKAFLATLVVVAVWALTKVFLLASYSIPTDSMEPTLTPRDYILVDKTYMGARLFSLNAAFEQRPFTMHRMWGRHRLQVGDVVVFNYPYYLLAKLYADPRWKRSEKMKEMARIVLTKKPKVDSPAIEEMRHEMRKLLTEEDNA